jgi:hypothetical protein
MLENLRPYAQRCIQGLAQSFLNKPVILPEDAMKAAIVAMAIQRHLCNGYCIAARDIACNLKSTDIDQAALQSLCAACNRAIGGLGNQLMRSYQLYAAAPAGVWLTLHSLFRIAIKAGIQDLMVEDDLLLNREKYCSISQNYHRILLLASAGPNKMRQFDVSTSYKLTEYWADLLVLDTASQDSENIHAINFNNDTGPIPRSFVPEDQLGSYQSLDFSMLLPVLNSHINKTARPQDTIPTGIPASLLEYLRQSWSEEFHRQHQREDSHQRLDVVVGMGSIHFHLCQGMPFENFVISSDKVNVAKPHNRYLQSNINTPVLTTADPWDNAFDAGGSGRNFDAIGYSTLDIESQLAVRERDGNLEKHPIAPIQSEDRSRSGYCLKWSENVPKSLRSGELIAIREPGSQQWSLALIRWVKQAKGSSQFGVEVISSNVTPLAISIIHKDSNDQDYMRAFLIAADHTSKQKASLITPSMPFQDGNKIRMNQRGHSRVAQLGRKIMGTGSISQFEYRTLEA